jgi:hypothetical protein
MQFIDFEALRREAFSSPQGESYAPFQSRGDHRVGVGARIKEKKAQYFIEVIVTFCRGEKPSFSEMDEKLTLLKTLETRGYTLTCEDDGSVTCEIHLPTSAIETEIETLSSRL